MRKIISILIALGLVLSLTVMATPVLAKVTEPVVTIPAGDDCEACPGAYNITFNITADLHSGTHSITIKFPTGTVIPTPVPNGAISVSGVPVFGSEVTVAGTTVTLLVPLNIVAPGAVWVFFSSKATWSIINPAAGSHTVWVNTSRAPDSTPVESAKYTIKPYYSSYKFVWDSSPTYPGLAKGFVPPFKMCGQNTTGTNMTGGVFNTTIGGFLNAFNITFMTAVEGCNIPCMNATISVELVSAPSPTSTVTLNFSGAFYSLHLPPPTGSNTAVVVAALPLAVKMAMTYNCSIHFDTVGEYQLCFSAACEAPPCPPPCCVAPELPEQCYDITVYQWKDAYKFPLYRKWNLISLPLVPLEEDIPIKDVLSALPDWDEEILAVWHYDRHDLYTCTDSDWVNYSPDGAMTSLKTLKDGRGYWVRTVYNSTHAMGTFIGNLWVWGTPKPVPPASPSEYPMCQGWEMIGFTEIAPMMDDAYLWNFLLVAVPQYGAVYGWYAGPNPGGQTWDTPFAPKSVNMIPGKGYWVSFGVPGAIYPP